MADYYGEAARALELNPRLVQAIHFRARMLSLAGRSQEAFQAQKAANEIGPFARPWAMVTLLDEARQYDAAIEEARQRLQAEPDPGIYFLMANAYRGKGVDKEWADAWENACSFPAIRPQPLLSNAPIVWGQKSGSSMAVGSTSA